MFQPALELQDTSGTNRLDRKFIIIKEEAGERAPEKNEVQTYANTSALNA